MKTSEGGSGGVVVCLGVGGMVDMEEMLGLDVDESGAGGPGDVEVWIMDSRRPWNLSNVFGTALGPDTVTGELVRKQTGVEKGRLLPSYQSGRGGIIVFDDGDIEEELEAEREAYCALEEMPEVGEDDDLGDGSEAEDDDDDAPPVSGQAPKKRKSWSDRDESESEESDDERPVQRRRSNSVCSDLQSGTSYLIYVRGVPYHPHQTDGPEDAGSYRTHLEARQICPAQIPPIVDPYLQQ
jgi:cell division control protein 45